MEELTDGLHEMFQKQIALQTKLQGEDFKIVGNQEYINMMVLAAMDELMEALRETPWKPWKKQQEFHQAKFKEEIIDLWHFVINLSLAAGMTSLEVKELFLMKNEINNKRKEEGY